MRKISFPKFNDKQIKDEEILDKLAVNDSLKCYPDLASGVANLKTAYKEYRKVRGKLGAIVAAPVGKSHGNHLKDLFKSPCTDLHFITSERIEEEFTSCPMCGSPHCGTLDHIFPQSDYPEFAVYSLNLVPACKCNIKRQNTTVGANAGERILHPYFDSCLNGRLLNAKFRVVDRNPDIGLELRVLPNHPEYPALSFHMREVVLKANITSFFRKQWSKFIAIPSSVIPTLQPVTSNRRQLMKSFVKSIKWYDNHYRNVNNWHSIFVLGLLDKPVLDWIMGRMPVTGMKRDDPLVDDVKRIK